jgi:peptidoglycan/xylan/chitin deacetylase (PgdA/CDA1 family)
MQLEAGAQPERGASSPFPPQFSMTPEEERRSNEESVALLERITGTRPVGFNAFWLRGTPCTLEFLQDLGFLYSIDDVSRDEPFVTQVRGRPFAIVPYTLRGSRSRASESQRGPEARGLPGNTENALPVASTPSAPTPRSGAH